jgi:hypothetical protein
MIVYPPHTAIRLIIAVIDTLLSVMFAVVCAILTALDSCLQESCEFP